MKKLFIISLALCFTITSGSILCTKNTTHKTTKKYKQCIIVPNMIEPFIFLQLDENYPEYKHRWPKHDPEFFSKLVRKLKNICSCLKKKRNRKKIK